jgi:hypothetical protein
MPGQAYTSFVQTSNNLSLHVPFARSALAEPYPGYARGSMWHTAEEVSGQLLAAHHEVPSHWPGTSPANVLAPYWISPLSRPATQATHLFAAYPPALISGNHAPHMPGMHARHVEGETDPSFSFNTPLGSFPGPAFVPPLPIPPGPPPMPHGAATHYWQPHAHLHPFVHAQTPASTAIAHSIASGGLVSPRTTLPDAKHLPRTVHDPLSTDSAVDYAHRRGPAQGVEAKSSRAKPCGPNDERESAPATVMPRVLPPSRAQQRAEAARAKARGPSIAGPSAAASVCPPVSRDASFHAPTWSGTLHCPPVPYTRHSGSKLHSCAEEMHVFQPQREIKDRYVNPPEARVPHGRPGVLQASLPINGHHSQLPASQSEALATQHHRSAFVRAQVSKRKLSANEESLEDTAGLRSHACAEGNADKSPKRTVPTHPSAPSEVENEACNDGNWSEASNTLDTLARRHGGGAEELEDDKDDELNQFAPDVDPDVILSEEQIQDALHLTFSWTYRRRAAYHLTHKCTKPVAPHKRDLYDR